MTSARHRDAPDYDYYHQVKERVGGKRPGLSVARKLARRIRFTLAELGDDALAPVDNGQLPELSGACRSEAVSAVA